MIYVENKKRKIEKIKEQYPNADILDITSTSSVRYAQILSPFFPHGNIPIPFSPGYFSNCVEGIWQGLKVFGSCGIDMESFSNNTTVFSFIISFIFRKIFFEKKTIRIEDLINERLEALDEIDVVDSNNVNTVISSKVNEQNNKVEFSRKKQELIKILDKFKRINPNISYDENMDVKELERIITEINI